MRCSNQRQTHSCSCGQATSGPRQLNPCICSVTRSCLLLYLPWLELATVVQPRHAASLKSTTVSSRRLHCTQGCRTGYVHAVFFSAPCAAVIVSDTLECNTCRVHGPCPLADQGHPPQGLQAAHTHPAANHTHHPAGMLTSAVLLAG
jgi:hypothetical protein